MRVLSGLAVVLALAAGCGSGAAGDTAQAPPQQQGQQQQQAQTKEQQDAARVQNLIADCMKAQGFTYVPHTVNYGDASQDTTLGRDPSLIPYDTLKTYRQKYGYAIYGRDVFPNDPNVGNTPQEPNPNNAIRDGLDPARREAYDKALNGDMRKLTADKANGKKPTGPIDSGCSGKASAEVYPPQPEKKPDPAKQAEYAQLLQQFQTDPQLLQASQGYAACLRQKGFQVASTKPGVIESTVQQIILKQRSELPDKIDAAKAQQGLQDEIKKSLEDLDCGREYEKLAKPFMEKMLASDGGNG